MSDPAAVKTLEDRDLGKYGDPDGPETFEGVVDELMSKGMTEQQAHEQIVGSARRSNTEYDRRHGIKKAKP